MKQSCFVGNPLSYVWAYECIVQPEPGSYLCFSHVPGERVFLDLIPKRELSARGMLLAQPASSHASCEFCVVSVSERALFELEHGDGVGTHFAHIAVKGHPLVEAVLREPGLPHAAAWYPL